MIDEINPNTKAVSPPDMIGVSHKGIEEDGIAKQFISADKKQFEGRSYIACLKQHQRSTLGLGMKDQWSLII